MSYVICIGFYVTKDIGSIAIDTLNKVVNMGARIWGMGVRPPPSGHGCIEKRGILRVNASGKLYIPVAVKLEACPDSIYIVTIYILV